MEIEIEPNFTVLEFSRVTQGGLVQLMNGSRAIAATTSAQPRPTKLLVTYDDAESRFRYVPMEGDPSVIAFLGELILRPDVASAFEGRPNANSRNELHFEGNHPLVGVHIQGTTDFALLNLTTGIIEASHAGQMFGFRKWSICTREGNESFTLMKFEPNKAEIFAKLAQP